MPSPYFPTKFAAGTGASGTLIASSTTNGTRIWQLVISNGTAGATVVISFTAAGAASTLTVITPATTTIVLPQTGVPWAIADVGTAITFTGGANTTINAYYTQP